MNLLICPPKRSQHQCLTGICRDHRARASSKLGVLNIVHHGPTLYVYLKKFAGHLQPLFLSSPCKHRPRSTCPEYRGPLVHAHHHPLDAGISHEPPVMRAWNDSHPDIDLKASEPGRPSPRKQSIVEQESNRTATTD